MTSAQALKKQKKVLLYGGKLSTYKVNVQVAYRFHAEAAGKDKYITRKGMIYGKS